MRHCLFVVALAAAASAQDLVVESRSDVVSAINGIMPVGDGTAYVTSGAARLWLVDLTTFDATMLQEGLPLSAPGRGEYVTGHAWLSDGLLMSDWNSEEIGPCCNGRTWLIDAGLSYDTLAIGNPVTSVGDPIDATVAPGGAWGDDVFVVDHQGASPDAPVVFRITEDGPEPFLQDATLWSINDSPRMLEFDSTGNYGGDLFVGEWFATPEEETIARIEPDGNWSIFFEEASYGDPRDLCFAGPGDFGETMFVLYESAGNGAIYEISPAGDSALVIDGLCDGGAGGQWALAYDDATDSLVAGTGDVLHVISYGESPCYADCNGDGVLNILDFVCFQAAFIAGQIEADCNRDCSYSILDFVCFQDRFVQGCP